MTEFQALAIWTACMALVLLNAWALSHMIDDGKFHWRRPSPPKQPPTS
ncbi:MAG: hypothetical protein AAEC10_07120 [Rhodospirillales bacterium]